MMRKAAKAVGSFRTDAFDIRFNPDCYCLTVRHTENEDITKQRRLVSEAAEFLVVQVYGIYCLFFNFFMFRKCFVE